MSSAWSAVKMRSGDTRGVGGPQEEQVNSAAPAAAPAAASAIVDDDNEGDDFSATISSQEPASVSVSKSSAHSTTTTKPSMTRRMLVPFARSSTLKSGSLQDLKSTLSSAMTSTKHQRQQQQQASSEVAAEQQPPLAGNQQSQQIAGPAPGPVAPTKDKVERQRSSQSRPARNPFRSSKSMLLLAQNQHIPQASTQLDCFISKQQADFLNYASQYNTSAAAAAAAAASGNANQSGSDNFWIQDNRLTGPVSGSHFASHEHHQELEGSDHSLSANASHRSNSQAIPMKTKGQMQDNSHHNHHHQQHLQQQQQHQVTSPRRLPHQGSSLAVTTVGGSSSSGCNALSSEQCNEQEHEDRPNCVHIMKKLFFSFLLGTIIAICWVMIIHTLKWIAIRGNEFELLQAQQQSSNNNINIITSSNIIANNANVDINLNELNQDQSSNNNNHNSDATNIHMAHHNQLSPAQHQALQVQAQPSLDQDLANGLQAPVPLRSNGPAAKAVAGSTSSIHKRSLHDTDQSNQVYQEAQFDKRKGRRRKAVSTRLGSIASIYNGSSSYKDVSDGYGDGTARRIRDNNEKIVSNSGARLAANVADDEAETKVPTMAPSNASAKIATKVSSVRDEINNRLRDTRRVSGDAAAGSRFRLERRQVSVSDTAGDQPPDDQDSPPPTPLMLTGQSMPTDENEELDSEGRRLVVASSIQQQPQGQGRRYRQHQQQLQQQQQQNNRTARPGSRRENSSDNGYLTGSTSQGGNSTNATATGGSSGGGKRLRRPQWPMATANQVGPASDLDLVSMPAELNSTADTRLSDRSRNEDDDSNEDDSNNNDGDYTATGGGVGGDAAASASSMGHKTNTNNNPIDEPLLIDGPGGPVVGSDAMLAVGSVQPSSSLERSSQPTISGLVYRAPFFTSWFVSTWNILFMPVFTLISSCCFRNEDSTTKKLLVESISQFMDNGLTTLQFLGRCAFFSVLWIGTIFGIVYSLAHLDATVVMALFACSAALVYLLSWVLLHQQFVGVRIVAVIICTTGIALLAYMDNSRTLGSVLIVAGSALCSAVYKVIYQRMFGFWSIAQMSLFFTLIGLFNAFLMWPIALMLYFLGVELIVWRYIPWMHLTAAGALHLTANIVAYFGPICTYDIFLTLGLLFAVVLSAVIDVTFYKITFFGMKLAGVLLLMIGFLVCLLPENWNEYLYDLVNERFIRWKKQRSLKKSRNKVQDMSTGQMSRLRTPSGRVK